MFQQIPGRRSRAHIPPDANQVGVAERIGYSGIDTRETHDTLTRVTNESLAEEKRLEFHPVWPCK